MIVTVTVMLQQLCRVITSINVFLRQLPCQVITTVVTGVVTTVILLYYYYRVITTITVLLSRLPGCYHSYRVIINTVTVLLPRLPCSNLTSKCWLHRLHMQP